MKRWRGWKVGEAQDLFFKKKVSVAGEFNFFCHFPKDRFPNMERHQALTHKQVDRVGLTARRSF